MYLVLYKRSNLNRMRIIMPSQAPTTAGAVAAKLLALGEQLRAQRKRLGVSATTAAEAAGMSRVTLHRIERGEPSVTMGAWLNAAAALGLELGVVDAPPPQPRRSQAAGVPTRIRLADYPQLGRLAWQFQGASDVSPTEALSLYERNWRHIDQGALPPHERALIQQLVASQGGSRLLV
jgi:transcriptional regulator with XRE-family HTH domain